MIKAIQTEYKGYRYGGRTITWLARTAGIVVTFVHVDLAAGTVEQRTVDGREVPL